MWFWRENSKISAFENKIEFLFQCWKLIELELLRFVMRRFKSRIFRKPFRIDWIQNLQRRKNFTVMIHLSYLLSFQVMNFLSLSLRSRMSWLKFAIWMMIMHADECQWCWWCKGGSVSRINSSFLSEATKTRNSWPEKTKRYQRW